ncbi:MAG: DMT family transporter [Clostridia bacterium]|nr:DMT family transporter [Clostridia bacterium]
MMNVLMLLCVIMCLSWQNISRKAYNQKVINGAFSFNLISILSAALFFALLSIPKFSFSKDFIIYAVLFALSYGMAMIFSFLAIAEGSLALTALIVSYSLILPSLYGILFLNESISLFLILGLCLLIISLLLININRNTATKITLKWLIFVVLAFLGNGLCSIFQKMQQVHCDGLYKNEFMLLSLTISAAIMLPAVLIKKEKFATHFKRSGGYAILCGLANGIVNLFVLILSGRMSVSVMFPIVSAGGIILSFIVSLLIYKEKLSVMQYIGALLGLASIILLNI